MTSTSQLLRFLIFAFCVFLTIISLMFFYNYYDELTMHIMKPYIKKRLQMMNLEEMKELLGSGGSNETLLDELNYGEIMRKFKNILIVFLNEVFFKKNIYILDVKNVSSNDTLLLALPIMTKAPKIKNIIELMLPLIQKSDLLISNLKNNSLKLENKTGNLNENFENFSKLFDVLLKTSSQPPANTQ